MRILIVAPHTHTYTYTQTLLHMLTYGVPRGIKDLKIEVSRKVPANGVDGTGREGGGRHGGGIVCVCRGMAGA